MTDREKVIEELKELCKYLYHEYNVCYRGDEEDTYNRFFIANKALELLKVQEPVKPERRYVFEPDKRFDKYRCTACDNILLRYRQHYCGNCGRELKWDD